MKLVIFGNSEIAKCAYEYFTYDSDFEVVAFTVDQQYINDEQNFLGLPLVSFEDVAKIYNPKEFHAFAAVGSQYLNRIRTDKYLALKQKGYPIASYVSSKIFKWHNVDIGEHAFILEDNTLQPFVKIGDNVTLWSGNHIGHSSIIQNNCFITSHVTISGCCNIGENSFIGVNSTFAEGLTIGKDNFIGMASIVSKSTESNIIIKPEKSKISELSAKKFCKVPEDIT